MNAHFKPALAIDDTAIAQPVERFGYRRARGADPVATVGALIVGLATVGAFAYMNPVFVKKSKRDITVVEMVLTPEDPPEAAPPPPPEVHAPPPKAAVVIPTAMVAIPQAPVVAAAPVAAPVPAPAQPKPAALAPAPRQPENMGELSAKMISAKPPRYPLDSRRKHEEGTVVLAVLLSTDGRITEVSIARSSGFPRLDEAALDAVRDWRWSPMMRDGAAVMVRGMVTIPFILQGGSRGSRGSRGGPDGPGGRHHDRDGRGFDGRGGPDRDGDRGHGRDRGPEMDGDTV